MSLGTARARFYTLDVFTEKAFAGNQLAVIPDATRLPETCLLPIAREFNFSETVFVYPPADASHTARVRIFTPGRELPFAGHPTIGTAVLLAAIRDLAAKGEVVVTLEERVGVVPVRVRPGPPAAYGQFTVPKLPERGPEPPSIAAIAGALSLEPSRVDSGGIGAAAFSCGVPFLFVPLRDRAAVAAAQIDVTAWRRNVARYWAPDVFIFAADPELSGSDFRARMFGPEVGVVEDPATGSAVAAFAGYLAARERLRDGTRRWRIEQGFEMGRPSILDLECDVGDGALTAVRVGGNAVIVSEGELRLG